MFLLDVVLCVRCPCVSAVSVGVRCCVQTFRGPPAASSSFFFSGSQTLVLHFHCCCLLFWAILRFLRCLLMLLFVLPQFLLVPLYLFLLFRCWHVLFLLLWYISHRNIFVRFLLLHRTRGLSGRPGGRLVTKGLGALCKDSSRRHRSIPFGFLRVINRVL
jgi:hypothetical protein